MNKNSDGEEVISVDADLDDADWTKQAWDLPPYKSVDFYKTVGPKFDAEHFRTTPAYKGAVARGLIHDDEWVGDSVEDWDGIAPKMPASRPQSRPSSARSRDGRIILHIHKG